MHEDLIEKIRCCIEQIRCGDCRYVKDCDGDRMLMSQATDAIEELSKKRVGTWHRVKASQRSYSFVCNSCGFMYPYLTRCCPNCGVEYIDEEPPKEEK